ncbi:MAG TPA: hypothetical protein VE282_07385 [Gemmatimonadales bacterium]|nr:hypothetical protein [Gemmatimonadales bacterium]
MFTDEEYVYKHDVEFRTQLQERLKSENLYGLCAAWTIDWLKHNLTRSPINTIYSTAQINQLIEKHKAYIAGRELLKYGDKEGISLRVVASGDISYHGGLKEFDNVALQPNGAYLVEIGEPPSSSRDTMGHIFGLFREENALLFFDQNFGLVRVTDSRRINEEYTNEIQLFEDDLDLKFRYWQIFQVTLVG